MNRAHLAGLIGLGLIGLGMGFSIAAPIFIGFACITFAAVFEGDNAPDGDATDDTADAVASEHLALLAQREREDEADRLHAEACMRLGISHPDFVERRS